MSERDRHFMRGQLATIGIFLDEDRKVIAKASPVLAPTVEPEVDRAEIRATLVELGAPAADLDWLVASCPGMGHALTYRPPARYAWCAICDGPSACDDNGCITCGSEL